MKIATIDGANLFIKCQHTTRINDIGNFVGCVEKFIKIIRNIIIYNNVDLVVVFWEGENSTSRKRYINASYKKGQKKSKRLSVPLSELQKCLFKIQSYLNFLSVPQIKVNETEADETIAYIAQKAAKNNHNIMIVSEDKDFYQLISDRISCYSISKRQEITKNIFNKKFLISPNNWIIYKCLCGDQSDNIKPLIHVSAERLKNYYFPVLNNQEKVTIDDICMYCSTALTDSLTQKRKKRIYKKIIKNADILVKNFQLMNLKDITLPTNIYVKLKYLIENFNFRKIEVSMLRYEAICDEIFFSEDSFNKLFQAFSKISIVNYNQKLRNIIL